MSQGLPPAAIIISVCHIAKHALALQCKATQFVIITLCSLLSIRHCILINFVFITLCLLLYNAFAPLPIIFIILSTFNLLDCISRIAFNTLYSLLCIYQQALSGIELLSQLKIPCDMMQHGLPPAFILYHLHCIHYTAFIILHS